MAFCHGVNTTSVYWQVNWQRSKVKAAIQNITLCSVPSNVGCGANDGAYYPIGLLSLGTLVRQTRPDVAVSIVDLHHHPDFQPVRDIVGISSSSTLNYRNVLKLARKAKDAGALVVLGGPHVTQLADQILRNRMELVDYVVRGHGEHAFVALLDALRSGSDLLQVPNLSWRDTRGHVIHNPEASTVWKYDDFLPLDMSLLSHGIEPYWRTFQQRIDQSVDAAFVVFTHFGCGYRETMKASSNSRHRLSSWCSYCSLNDALFARRGEAIVNETLGLLRTCNVPRGAKVLLKCYGDNVGSQRNMLQELATAIDRNNEWRQYQIGWTFYCQSSRLSPELAELLARIGTQNVYIGFDSADDEIQKLNGLGTSLKSHWRAIELCKASGLKIQAGFVLGCAGETERSLDNTLRFAEQLSACGVLERINSAILFIIPGSPAYWALCEHEPWIRNLDEFSTTELRRLWVKHFCPNLGSGTDDALERLRFAANRLDELSPGPHASMGFVSNRLAANLTPAEPVYA